ncbi:glycoside hydrolase family 3 C-terminal domain-containing protein [Terribacillus saccharophilus]|uniref:glycoside hydrolase family 3 C-terminal domain-containing protein n=1 Tax=Terribacillus saccharophilus TaxID=361277 RepID=UPI002DC1F702|nr:glycoside hydrolase family 3 C-terminal domain-containing protein [Terribacillus saccharophilus]MEC0290320.1 glycoside hydrolase family 3 C-terminal domain-containing protein [Terribacillus saccharophilus]
MNNNINDIIGKMTLEEKVRFCSGTNFWETESLERLSIPSMRFSDGPNGLRKSGEDIIAMSENEAATCFPAPAAYASSWDRELVAKLGNAIADEALAADVQIVLGPGVNIKRSPLGGRNFEYLSEDPYVAGELAVDYIKAMQAKGVGTSVKHFAANNREYRRMEVDTIVDERTLHEIYYPAFEKAIKKAQPWTVMTAYNKLNGYYASEHEELLQQILHDDWKFEGFVVSDWGAVDDRVQALKAGLAVEMPPTGGLSDEKIKLAIEAGELDERVLDERLAAYLRILFKTTAVKQEKTYNQDEHHALAEEIATESIVLLRNEKNILPLNTTDKVAIIGDLADNVRYRGGGSSQVNPTKLDTPLDKLREKAGENIQFARGYSIDGKDEQEQFIKEAEKAAESMDKVILFLGLPEEFESEGFDKLHLRLPENQELLVKRITAKNQNVIVVLSNGSPIEMPWRDQVDGIVEIYLGGQAVGGAITKILYGEENPSGKLTETFPLKLEDTPSYLNFNQEKNRVVYQEGIFVGYRYYEKKNMPVLYPFGYGLSYTEFQYDNLKLSANKLQDSDTLNISFTLKNTGKRAGKEVAQVYISDRESSNVRPVKELKGFEKVLLAPGESKTVTIELDPRAFSFYDPEQHAWRVETGSFDILVGSSSEAIHLSETVEVTETVAPKMVYDRNSTVSDVLDDPQNQDKMEELLLSLRGKLVLIPEDEENVDKMMFPMLSDLPLRGLIIFSQGQFTDKELDEFIQSLNN